ncbi:ATP-binding cassette domain-containing protein [Helicobacter baculiformis]|nr:ATP-binding cassette domain-containing protein [Helicobacter baculiformis]
MELVNLAFELESAKITAMLGKSGSGKSLTAMSMFGFLPSGFKGNSHISLGEEPYNPSHLSIIMQNPRTAFNTLMTIGVHAKESLQAIGKWDGHFQSKIEKAMHDVCLDLSVLNKYPFELSGGMLQRAMIALALLKEPKFIIADEPTTDLDLVTQSKILELIINLKEKKQVGFLLITHDFGVVRRVADHVLVISEGKIIQSGGVNHIFEQPKPGQTKLLVDAYKAFITEKIDEDSP